MFRAAVFCLLLTASAATRMQSLDGAWQFSTDNRTWRPLYVPHNLREIGEQTPGSRRQVAYRRSFNLEKPAAGQRVVVQALNATGVEIVVNNAEIGKAPAESFWLEADVTGSVKPGENVLLLRAVSPGIQGGVRLHVLDPVHLDLEGILADTPSWRGGPATVRVRTAIENRRGVPAKTEMAVRLQDPEGREIASSVTRAEIRDRTEVETSMSPVGDPPLWSPDNPRVCRISVILTVDGEVVEQKEIPFGFRWFRFDPDKGFFLNGLPLKLYGTVYPLTAPDTFADRAAFWRNESRLLKDMGVNFVRPTPAISDEFLAECDRAGLLATVRVHDFGEPSRMTINMRRDVRQKFNHPSVIAWNYVTEGASAAQADIRNEAASKPLRHHDPGRVILVNELGWRSPGSVGLIDADVAGQGNYTGWYEGTLEHIGPYMDRYRELLGERYGKPLPVVISNYGAAADPAVHSDSPRRNDFSSEYFTGFHRRFAREIAARPWVSGGLIFAWRDLEADQAIPRHTWKGIIDKQERPRDAYYVYQSLLSTKPMVKIAQSSWTPRDVWPRGAARRIEVFSNQPAVELFLGGRSLGRRTKAQAFVWDVVFGEGDNALRAVAGGVHDEAAVRVRFQPPATEPVSGRLRWRWVNTGWLMSSPALADLNGDRKLDIVIGSYNGDVYALSHDGKLLWTYKTGDTVFSSPLVIARPPMIVFTSSRAVYALTHGGKLLWKHDGIRGFDRNPKSPAAADLDGDGAPEFAIASDTGALLLLDAQGKLRWKYSTAGTRNRGLCLTTPMIVDRKVLFAADDGFTYLLDAQGRLLWKHDNVMQGAVPGQPPNGMWPSAAGGVIYSGAGTLKAHDLTGRVLWERKDLNGPTQVSAQGVTVFQRDTFTLVGADGRDIWRFSLGDRRDFLTQPPVTADVDEDGEPDYVFGTRGTHLVAVSSRGKLLWKFPTEDEISGSPAVADLDGDGVVEVVFGSRDGYVYVLGAGKAPPNALQSLEFRGGPDRRAAYLR
ncbi:MAG: PQQ-binding-like beta-propeller repeat protein [Bryobacteraceae bacterium]